MTPEALKVGREYTMSRFASEQHMREEMLSEIARLRKELEAYRADAELYRWMRSNYKTSPAFVGIHSIRDEAAFDEHFSTARLTKEQK